MSVETGNPQQRLQLLLSSCSPSELDDPKTNSSILDFLNQEQRCWSASNDDCASDVDIDGIFDEINRLSGLIHESRSVDEILKEAEHLILSQTPIQLKCTDVNWLQGDEECVKEELVTAAPTTIEPEANPHPDETLNELYVTAKDINVHNSPETHLSKVG